MPIEPHLENDVYQRSEQAAKFISVVISDLKGYVKVALTEGNAKLVNPVSACSTSVVKTK